MHTTHRLNGYGIIIKISNFGHKLGVRTFVCHVRYKIGTAEALIGRMNDRSLQLPRLISYLRHNVVSPSVYLSVCNALHCGAQDRGKGSKVVRSCS